MIQSRKIWLILTCFLLPPIAVIAGIWSDQRSAVPAEPTPSVEKMGLSASGTCYQSGLNIACDKMTLNSLPVNVGAGVRCLPFYGVSMPAAAEGQTIDCTSLTHFTLADAGGPCLVGQCDCDIRRKFLCTIRGGVCTSGGGSTTDQPIDAYCGFNAGSNIEVNSSIPQICVSAALPASVAGHLYCDYFPNTYTDAGITDAAGL